MTIKWRFATLGLALAALLVSAFAATGPRAMAAAGTCANAGRPVFFGLHGMYEGPSKTVQQISPEIQGFDYEQNLISGAVLNVPVPYPTATASLQDMVNLGSTVATGEKHLQSHLANWAQGCKPSQLRIALVGYSMGAWVIATWLLEHPAEWNMIRAVVLYGDPCWIHSPDAGLLRYTGHSGVPDGCSPVKYYPYPAPHQGDTHPPIQSWCIGLSGGGDPVCGGGFGGWTNPINEGKQVTAATQCKDLTCPHNWYRVGQPGEATLKSGAQFVVQKLIG
jgi:hypothetical protein